MAITGRVVRVHKRSNYVTYVIIRRNCHYGRRLNKTKKKNRRKNAVLHQVGRLYKLIITIISDVGINQQIMN